MRGASHIMIGCAGVLAVEALAASQGRILADTTGWSLAGHQVPELPLLLAAAAIGSLLPDIDHPSSTLSNLSPLTKTSSVVMNCVTHHRGATHSLAALGIITYLAATFGTQIGYYYAAMAFAFGYLLHLAADSLTHAGIPWLWPLVPKSMGFPLLRVTTGGITEAFLVLAVLLGTGYVIWEKGFPLV
jgi:inner membrane protein